MLIDIRYFFLMIPTLFATCSAMALAGIFEWFHPAKKLNQFDTIDHSPSGLAALIALGLNVLLFACLFLIAKRPSTWRLFDLSRTAYLVLFGLGYAVGLVVAVVICMG